MNVTDNTERHRYELVEEGAVVAFEDYALDGERIDLVHTEVAEGHDGRGLARQLVEAVLVDVRARGLQVVPSCSYVAGFIAKNPAEYLDLVPEDERARFGLAG